jgi:hypothetical protein
MADRRPETPALATTPPPAGGQGVGRRLPLVVVGTMCGASPTSASARPIIGSVARTKHAIAC